MKCLLFYFGMLVMFFTLSVGVQAKTTTVLPGFAVLHFQKVKNVCDFDVLLSGFKSSDVQDVFLNSLQHKFVVSGLSNVVHIQQKNCKTGKNEVAVALKNYVVLVKDVQLEYRMQKGILTKIVLKYVGGKLKKFLCYTDLKCAEQVY